MPDRIEGSVFAFLSSANNLAYNIISTLFAVFVNDYIMDPPLTNSNINLYYKIAFIAMILQPLSWCTNLIVPSKETV